MSHEGSPSGRRLRLGLIGLPIAKSLSPVMHAAALRLRGIAGTYERFETDDPRVLEGLFAELRAGSIDGLNATVPHKLAAYAACDRHAPLAARVGAVNTLVRVAGTDARSSIEGWNTDLPGLVAAINGTWPHPRVGPALVIGAGGAAPAAMLAADALGATEVRVWNRTRARADALVKRLGLGVVHDDAATAARDATLVIQASSHGMGLVGEALLAAEREAHGVLSVTDPTARVVDLVYRPRATAWVCAARSLGRDAMDGLEMLVHQAALAFELWTSARTDVSITSCAAHDLLEAMRAAALGTAAEGDTDHLGTAEGDATLSSSR